MVVPEILPHIANGEPDVAADLGHITKNLLDDTLHTWIKSFAVILNCVADIDAGVPAVIVVQETVQATP